ncbi:hypothetical protein PUN28_019403 [Cardiocondyla obscurior]|uniref:Uncharacterized protein n=1 Tax=Cardiocondyla obscurior TaxID=286306 RepID=A0AAW2ECN5_9HYME
MPRQEFGDPSPPPPNSKKDTSSREFEQEEEKEDDAGERLLRTIPKRCGRPSLEKNGELLLFIKKESRYFVWMLRKCERVSARLGLTETERRRCKIRGAA